MKETKNSGTYKMWLQNFKGRGSTWEMWV